MRQKTLLTESTRPVLATALGLASAKGSPQRKASPLGTVTAAAWRYVWGDDGCPVFQGEPSSEIVRLIYDPVVEFLRVLVGVNR